jgi:predicted nucleic acid-binding protein
VSGFLLDTCTAGRWFNKDASDVDGRLKKLGDPEVYLSAISVGEFLCGHASPSNTDQAMQAKFRAWINQEFKDFMVEVDQSAAESYGPFRSQLLEKYAPKNGWGKGKKRVEKCMDVTGQMLGIDENDLWLVAQTDAHNLTLITMDKMTNIRNAFGSVVPIIYWPENPAEPAEYSQAALNLHGSVV